MTLTGTHRQQLRDALLWAAAKGRLDELVRGARTFFPGSEQLKTVTLLRADGFAFSSEAVWRNLGFGTRFRTS